MEKINKKDTVGIANLTIGYVAWFREHYCIVSLTPKGIYVFDDQERPVVQETAKEGESFDVNAANKIMPDVVRNYIIAEYYTEKEDKAEEVNSEEGE